MTEFVWPLSVLRTNKSSFLTTLTFFLKNKIKKDIDDSALCAIEIPQTVFGVGISCNGNNEFCRESKIFHLTAV